MEYTLRRSIPEDAKFVNDLTRKTMRNYVEAIWSEESDRENYYVINQFHQPSTEIIEQDGKPIGRLSLNHNEEGTVLDEIHLIPEVQGLGIGTKIIKSVLHDAQKQGKSVFLMVLETNPAKKLYERLGFVTYKQENHRYYLRFSGITSATNH